MLLLASSGGCTLGSRPLQRWGHDLTERLRLYWSWLAGVGSGGCCRKVHAGRGSRGRWGRSIPTAEHPHRRAPSSRSEKSRPGRGAGGGLQRPLLTEPARRPATCTRHAPLAPPPLPRHVWTWSLNSPGKGRAKLPAEEEVPGGWRGPGRRQQRGRDRSPCRTPGPGHRLAPAAASPWGRGRCQLRGPRLSTAGGAEPTYWLQGPGCLTASREEGGVGSTELPQAETRSRVSGQAVPTLAVA